MVDPNPEEAKDRRLCKRIKDLSCSAWNLSLAQLKSSEWMWPYVSRYFRQQLSLEFVTAGFA